MTKIDQRHLIQQLQAHVPHNTIESAHLETIIAFLNHTKFPFDRTTLEGHITGSAIVVDPTYHQILLLHHRKLDRWLQPGGHCDGDPCPLAVACKEVAEETGLTAVTPISSAIFDVDVHRIPTKGDVPEHWHYDIRYLFVTDDREALQKSEREAIDLRWFSLTQLEQINPDDSLNRVKDKLNNIRWSKNIPD